MNNLRPLKAKRANVGKVVVVENRAPIRSVLPNGNVLITHREFIAKVPGSVNFSLSQQPINPGMPAQFKWLYAIAAQYESYVFRKLSYHFVNSKAGTFAGEVIMGIDYDPTDDNPFNEDELQNYWGSKTGQICEPLILVADQKAMHKIGPSKFVRSGAPPSNTDKKLYDSGSFFVATSDCADTSTIGRIFVEYSVELITPNSNLATPYSASFNAVGETQAAPLGTSLTAVGSATATWLSTTTFSIDFPGQYLCVWICAGTVITASLKITSNTGASVFSTPNDAIVSAATSAICVQIIKVSAATDVFTVGSTATTLTVNAFRLALYQYASG